MPHPISLVILLSDTALLAVAVLLAVPLVLLSVPLVIWSRWSARRGAEAVEPDPSSHAHEEQETCYQMMPKQQRPYDLVLYGATGFTGRLVVDYLSNKAGAGSLQWAIAGRNLQALQQLAQGMPEGHRRPDVLAASNPAELLECASRTRVLLSTAGPFAKCGTAVVRACVVAGTDYADITGETDWVRTIIRRFDSLARGTGARIAVHCGHDCIPWDMACFAAAKDLQEKHQQQLCRISCYCQVAAAPSGGTLATLAESLSRPPKAPTAGNTDPLMLLPGGGISTATTKVKPSKRGATWAPAVTAWITPFVMSPVMANCFRRSNALLRYGDHVVFSDSRVQRNLPRALLTQLHEAVTGLCVLTAPLRVAATTLGLLPAPGQGPSRATMENGALTVRVRARGALGARVDKSITFHRDPGYLETAMLLVESGLLLLREGGAVTDGGVYTPAACFGNNLLRSLEAVGNAVVDTQSQP